VDTATPAVVAGLAAVHPGGRVELLAARADADARRHGELLAPSVAAVLAAAGRSAGELSAVVAGLGPGPYTGLRVGLVTAAALADALAVPAYGVCSLDAVARPVAAGRRVLAATDARRREVYWAAYDEGGRRTAGPAVDRPADLAGRLAGLGVGAMCGAGARLYADVLGLPLLPADHPAPAALAELAADRVLAGAPADPLTPLYLRRPDAAQPGPAKAVTPA
jgi:tRNA threonylcarbamoyl adenosine modification protein YeaZ